ncbi:hypothetical protein QQX98_010149 [Neonectria punicea]|uniref:Nephrocystin 3-like N-terminal domain-containing protein n=1 Tax=Neonectria punicea TaxID=979145 RepID=A0ABR1GQM0_9HYPO
MSDPNNYTVGWICAITTEYVAAQVFLDETHEAPEAVLPKDTNHYTLGRIGTHNVVVAVLPDGEYGTSSAASVATNMLHSFPNVRIGLMVGIGGGAPSERNDIRLGDIVVSASRDGKGAVFQYAFGKTKQEQPFQYTGLLNQPPKTLRTALAGIKAQYEKRGHHLEKDINANFKEYPKLRRKYGRPHSDTDRLFKAELTHDSRGCAAVCAIDRSNLVRRPERTGDDDNPAIHYGLIASADQLMKDALVRDRLGSEEGVLCFEMEAAGLMNDFPCLVIRGICDYSDSHKNKEWQGYAAMAAAAYAKDLLRQVPAKSVETEKRIVDILSGMADVQQCVRHVEQSINLAKLRPVEDAAFDSQANGHDPRCYPETRIDLLAEIHKWADDPGGKCIYWLRGMAGTGKSTISRTVAKRFHDSGVLGASFLFKRGEGDHGKAARLFTTVASQLVRQLPSLARHVQNAIENSPAIADKTTEEQFERLILEPLAQYKGDGGIPALRLVVIDALDECDREHDATNIIRLLARAREVTSIRLRFFVTSRPELPIRLGFRKIGDSYNDLSLHEVPKTDIEKDITIFLKRRLDQIRENFNEDVATDLKLPSDWPCSDSLQSLVDAAVPLFIFAATACLFISDGVCGDPEERLKTILEYHKTGGPSQLHGTYLPILNQLLLKPTESGSIRRTEDEKADVVEWFREIVGAIVILANPLATAPLARLLDKSQGSIASMLSRLHSVLHVPANPYAPVKLLHLSFRDFLVDRENRDQNPFWVDERETHGKLATNCLNLLLKKNCLRKDICGLGAPGSLREHIDKQKIDECLPPEVQYACLYWVSHLNSSGVKLHDGHQAFRFLQRHFLHWLEALNLMERIPESIGLIDELRNLVDVDTNTKISRFLDDAKRFVLNCHSAMNLAPLQLYSSAIVFAPETSAIRETFEEHITWITKKPIMERNWNPCLQTLGGHNDAVVSIAISSNSGLLATGSHDKTVKLWDAATGSLQRTLEGHCSELLSVTFSSDGRQLRSVDVDGIIKLWDAATGAIQRTTEQCIPDSYDGRFYTVALSRDGGQIALGLNNGTVQLRDTTTGALQHTLQDTLEDSDDIWSVALSGNSRWLASGSEDTTVKIWDAETGALQRTLKGHIKDVNSVAFSSNSRQLASGSDDCLIKLWDVATGALQRTLKGHSYGVASIAFSSNGRQLASGSHDGTVKLWDTATGAPQCTFKGHTDEVSSVAFFKDNMQLISGSEDVTIKFWDAEMGVLQCKLQEPLPEGHSDSVQSIAFSSNGGELASSSDRTVKLWDATTGALQHTLEGCHDSIALSSDGRQLAIGPTDMPIKLYDTKTGQLQRTFEGHGGIIWSIALSSDSRLLASGSYGDKIVKLWDVATGELQHTLEHSDSVWSFAFSSDGRQLASGEMRSGTIKVWDTKSGVLQHTLQGDYKSIMSVAFSSDGGCLASGSSDYKIMIWDMATGTLQRTLEVEITPRSLSFDATGSYLLTELGLIQLSPIQVRGEAQPGNWTGQAADKPQPHGYGLSPGRVWITWNGNNMLWLPPDFQHSVSAVSPSTATIALGCNSGRVLVIGFPAKGPPRGQEASEQL